MTYMNHEILTSKLFLPFRYGIEKCKNILNCSLWRKIWLYGSFPPSFLDDEKKEKEKQMKKEKQIMPKHLFLESLIHFSCSLPDPFNLF